MKYSEVLAKRLVELKKEIDKIKYGNSSITKRIRKDDDFSKFSDKELILARTILHKMYDDYKNKRLIGWSVEDLVNYNLRLLKEMKKRKMDVEPFGELDKITNEFQHIKLELGDVSNEELVILHARAHKNQDWDEHEKIVEEMLKRGLEHRPLMHSKDEVANMVFLEDIIDYFKSFKVKHPFIFLVGSTVVNGYGNDIDILIRSSPDNPFNRILEFRISQMFPPELRERLHFVYDEEGPFTAYIPLFELSSNMLRKEYVQMSKAELEFFKPFQPPKTRGTYHKDEFYTLDAIKKYYVPIYIGNGKPVAVENKVDGIRIIVEKKGDKIAMYTEDKKQDIANRLPHVVEELKKILPKNVILDVELVNYNSDGTPMERKDITKIATAKNQHIDDSHVVLWAHDILWYNDKNLLGLPYGEYRKYLDKIPEGKHFKKTISIVAKTEKQLIDAIKKVRVRPESEGAMLKPLEAPYNINGPVDWAKFKNSKQLYVEVMDVHKVKGSTNTYNYEIGVRDKNNKLVSLGRTFNTNILAKKGDIIEVSFTKLIKSGSEENPKYGLFGPRVIAVMPDRHKPDTIEMVKQIAAVGNKPFSRQDLEAEIEIQKHEKRLEELSSDDNKFIGEPGTTSDVLMDLKGKKGTWVLQWHGRGIPTYIKKSDIKRVFKIAMNGDPQKAWKEYKKLLKPGDKADDVSIHLDMRFDVGDHLVGITLDTPGNLNMENRFPESWKHKMLTQIKARQPCFIPGNKILTRKGFKNVEQLDYNDELFDLNGKKNKIKNIDFTFYKGDVFEIRGFNGLPKITTPNHPFLVVDVQRCNKNKISYCRPKEDKICKWCKKKVEYKLKWVEANKLKPGMFLFQPKFKIKKNKQLTYDEGYLYGFLLGDGAKHNKNQMRIYLNRFSENDERILKEKLLPIIKNISTTKPIIRIQGSCNVVTFTNKELREKFNESYLDGKKIINKLEGNEEYFKGIIDGLVDADGFIDKNGRKFIVNTSDNLIGQIIILLQYLNLVPSIRYRNNSIGKKLKDKIKNPLQKIYEISWSEKTVHSNKRVIDLNEGFAIPIKNVKRFYYEGKIYNIETEDHTISHENGQSHNSIWKEIKAGYFKPGEVGATAKQAGVMFREDYGTYETGKQVPYFHELFLNGKKYKGRFVIRKLSRNPEYKKAGKAPFMWLSWLTKSQTPYILSRGANYDDYKPEVGISMIPERLEKEISPENRWWTKKYPKKKVIEMIKNARKELLEKGLIE